MKFKNDMHNVEKKTKLKKYACKFYISNTAQQKTYIFMF